MPDSQETKERFVLLQSLELYQNNRSKSLLTFIQNEIKQTIDSNYLFSASKAALSCKSSTSSKD